MTTIWEKNQDDGQEGQEWETRTSSTGKLNKTSTMAIDINLIGLPHLNNLIVLSFVKDTAPDYFDILLVRKSHY